MIYKKIIQKLFYKRISSPVRRDYSDNLFLSEISQQLLSENGYVHLKNVLTKEQLNELLITYAHIKKNNEFEKTDYYVNSVSFKSEEIKKYTRTQVTKIVEPSLQNFLFVEKIRFPISVGYCINPVNSTSGSRPHQDPNLVDETKSYSIVLWISLNDTTLDNGCLQVLKGSHLWGNHLRSNFHVKWHFEEFIDTLIWKNMQPIPTKAGDIICFDPALIHASGNNTTDKERLAVQISAIPKEQRLVSIVEQADNLIPNAQYYNIDEDYFTDESVYKYPSKKYPIIKEEKNNYYYTTNDIENLLLQTNK